MDSKESNRYYIREVIKEKRTDYFVEYYPANDNNFLAIVNLIYLEEKINFNTARNDIEKEFYIWLEKYPIPQMVSAFNHSGDLIYLDDTLCSSLSGFINLESREITAKWDLLKDDEFPDVQKTPQYQKNVYKDLPVTEFDPDKAKSMFIREAKLQKRLILIYGISVILFPLIIEIIALGINWLNWLIIISGWLIALFKIGKFTGCIKPTEAELNELKKKHYYYHCERNQKGFLLLRNENYKQEQIKTIHQEYKSIDN
ncbi:hypothetical protein [Legionella gresilensis]|uniref:hypothetical protein n=1 Tax=Legionella gresilensis TaxID=91823 RepID=UPI001040FC14|nr:hypothetical protein [Legionella gresilensis]